MTKTSFPFDAGPGANVTEDQWRKMGRLWLPTGPLLGEDDQLEVFADSSGMQVKVRSGKAWLRGHYFESDAEETLPIPVADPTNPRDDRVIMRGDFVANTVDLAVLTGIPAVSPTPPALTQSASRWEVALATVRVDAAASTIAAGKVTDERALVPTRLEDGPHLLGRTTLAAPGNVITVGPLPARRFLRVLVHLIPSGGSISMDVTLNNDTGNNYTQRRSTNGAAEDLIANQPRLFRPTGNVQRVQHLVVEISNKADQEKLASANYADQNSPGAGNVPSRVELVGKWANTADPITRVDVTNGGGGTGTYAAGSSVAVLGHD